MPLTDEHKEELFRRLEAAGWHWREGFIYAPHGSIWFQREGPWVGDLDEVLSRMWGRLKRIRNNDTDERTERDTAQLVEILRVMVRDSTTSPLVDHVVGCIVGGAIGDCMGGPVEGLRKVTEDMLQGQWKLSDDSTLTLATCEAVREAGLAVEPIAAAFLRWHKAGRISGLGASTLKALRDLETGAHWALSGRRGEMGAGNGAAMRVAPLAFMLDLCDRDDRRAFRDICRISHHNDEAYAGALAVVLAMHLAIRDPARRLSLDEVADEVPDTLVRDRLRALHELPSDTTLRDVALDFGSSGYVVESVPLALLAASKLEDGGFATILRELVLAGGDTDTNASIFGQVAGARLGFDALPMDLVEQVPEVEWIEHEARLFSRAVLATGKAPGGGACCG